MAWVHDSGYEPAYAHVGYPVAIQIDGTETASSTGRTPLDVIGWRSGCDCGWRGMQFYSRREWPSTSALAPDGVDGWDTGTAAFGEWERHLNRALPELAVHDLARQLAEVEERLARACQAARFAGVSWARLTAITGGTAAIEFARRREAADNSSTTTVERQLRHGRRAPGPE